jgi:hypothetical protein
MLFRRGLLDATTVMCETYNHPELVPVIEAGLPVAAGG